MISAFFAWRFFKISWELSIVSVVVLFLVVLVIFVLFIVSVVIVVGFLIVVVIIVFFLIAFIWKRMWSTMSTDEQSKRRALITVGTRPTIYRLSKRMVG